MAKVISRAPTARPAAGKAHALATILGWSALWVFGALVLAVDHAQHAGLAAAYAAIAFAGMVIGTRSYLRISQEHC